MERIESSQSRELFRDGARWIVREADTSHVPGARAERCLIFESEGVVRRAWSYPTDWPKLSDTDLWALLGATPILPSRGASTASVPRLTPRGTPVAGAAAVSSRARSLLHEVGQLRENQMALAEDRRVLIDRCDTLRRDMHQAIEAYAESLRGDGTPPERVLVLVKAAMADGLGPECSDEPVAAHLLQEGVEHCIAAYYAA